MLKKLVAFVAASVIGAMNTAKKSAVAVATVFVVASAMTERAAAAIPVTELTDAITEGITAGEALIGAGLAVTAIFIIAKIIKRGARSIG